MSKWIVDIHGEIEGDYELIKKYEEPKTGHWIITPHGPKCSKCLIVHSHTSIFCPSCGVKMVEQETKINEDISKGFEEFTRMMFRQGQEESEEINADSN